MSPEEVRRLAIDARPRLSWRIGVIGEPGVGPADENELAKALDGIFASVAAALDEARRGDGASAILSDKPAVIAVVSPLAEGADRFGAHSARARGFELRAPLPFAKDDYVKDFPETVPEFEQLLEYARTTGGVIELDGVRTDKRTRDEARKAVGEFVVRNCDLLIAVVHPNQKDALTQTDMLARYARKVGVPVIEVSSEEATHIALFESGTGKGVTYDPKSLTQSIAAQIVPKLPERHSEHERRKAEKARKRSIAAAARYFRKEPVKATELAPDFLFAGPLAPGASWPLRAVSKIFPAFVKLLGRVKSGVAPPEKRDPPCGRDERSAQFLYLHHHRADVLATFYANVHRSVFLLMYALSALALSFAVSALYFPGLVYVFTGLELAVLIATGLLYAADNWFGWRNRWLEYRLLAELLREADLLAQIGRPMPFAKIDELADALPGRAWVPMAHAAIARRAGIVSQKFDAAHLTKFRDYAAETRLQDQIAYHAKAGERAESIAAFLRIASTAAFAATVVAAAVKLLWHEGSHYALGLLAGVLPAFAYACFGIRNQAEFEIVSRRSERMHAKLTRLQKRIRALKGESLTSDALGREILVAARVMRHDAADWASIFEVKETDL